MSDKDKHEPKKPEKPVLPKFPTDRIEKGEVPTDPKTKNGKK
ncbi:hypothetical protein SAMN04488033_12216 [Salegentibacter agarivorans]|uniref:Uncharacterized protein n=1 Tax=Salegentibacter agarivorans TaxID=345907 RepID=A0A1I2NKF4_9FLAO|nr:hypothetical protein [Salegentibacter agarivorans]SFG03490.1 hypothetical protein SAMN04488033_12216 [Salegentibacter agarivorans]